MFRKTLFILFIVFGLWVVADWRRSTDDTCPTIQPIVDLTQDSEECEWHEIVLSPRGELKAETQASLDKALDKAKRLLDAIRQPEVDRPRPRLGDQEVGAEDAIENRLQTIDAALVRARREVQQVETDIRSIEQETAARREEIHDSKLPSSTRCSRLVELEASHRQEVRVLEDRRDSLFGEIERIQAMRDRLEQRG